MNITKLTTNDTKKKNIQIRSFLFIFLIVLNLLTPILFKSVAHAETSVFSDLELEYNRNISAWAMAKCYEDVKSIKKEDLGKNKSKDVGVQVGGMWNNGSANTVGDDGNINCDNSGEFSQLSAILGFTDPPRGIQEYLYPLSGCKDKDTDCESVKKGFDDTRTYLLAHTKTPNLSSSGLYWYWEQLLINNSWGCGMQRIAESDPEKKFANKPIGLRYEAPNNDLIWKVDSDGKPKGYKYAIFKNESAKLSMFGPDPTTNSFRMSGVATCTKLVEHLAGENGQRMAKAVYERYQAALTANPDKKLGSNERTDANEETAAEAEGNKESCEERTKLSSGWIVCMTVELLSDKMDDFKKNIDELMDVDVASMNDSTTGNLKQSWGFFRILASFLLLAVGIVVIMSQAIGGGS